MLKRIVLLLYLGSFLLPFANLPDSREGILPKQTGWQIILKNPILYGILFILLFLCLWINKNRKVFSAVLLTLFILVFLVVMGAYFYIYQPSLHYMVDGFQVGLELNMYGFYVNLILGVALISIFIKEQIQNKKKR